MPTLSSRSVLALVALSAAACMPPQGGAAAPSSSRPEPGKASAESLATLTRIVDQNVNQCQAKTAETNAKLGDALDKVSGGKPDATGKPAPSLAAVVAKLRAEKVHVSIDVLGSPDMPMLLVKDSFAEEGQKLAGAPPAKLQAYAKRASALMPMLTALRDDVQAVNAALGASFGSTLSCNGFAKGLTTQLGAMQNGDQEPSPELFAAYAKMLSANEQSKTVVASSIATISVLQAGLAGKDAKAFDALVAGVRKAKDAPVEVSDEDARKAYRAAGQALVDACREQMEKAYAAHPEMKRPAVDPCSKEGSRVKGSPAEEAARAELALPGSGDLADEAIRRLVPKDSPLADANDALAAVKKGDFLSALKSASKLVGRVSPLGSTLSSVLSMFG